MTPKITERMAKMAIEDGAEVTEKKQIRRPKPKPTPIPAPASQDSKSELAVAVTIRRTDILEATIDQQLKIAQKQVEELSRLVAILSDPTEPIRLKVHRNMDRTSPAYLLMEYIDVIPVNYSRKLDS